MADPHKVSICIPCLNAERHLEQCIRSALGQTWPHTEVLVADNGSTDRSPEIIASFGPRIRTVHPPGRGAPVARNALRRAATGTWIQFLDADDFLLPNKIETQFREAAEPAEAAPTPDANGADALASPVWWEDHRTGHRRQVPEPGTESFDPCRQILLYQIPQTAGFLWRARALDQIGGWDESIPFNQDWDLYLRAVRHGLRFRFTPSPNAVYRMAWSPNQLSMRNRPGQIASNLRLFLTMQDWMSRRGSWSNEVAAACAPAAFGKVRTLARTNLLAAARLHRQLRALGLWSPADPGTHGWSAKPYCTAYRLLGFLAAELLARLKSATQ